MASQNSSLNPEQRAADIQKLRNEEFDILVIGGGVVGSGIALDAASRGLKVALVEANDFASGTSSRSSKLIHGGLRYLEQFDFKLVGEALKEREMMITTQAPHLVKPLSFLYPLHRKFIDRVYVGAGLMLYDLLRGSKRAVPWHSHISTSDTRTIARSLDPQKVIGGLLYYDAQVDDARHTMMVARTAKSLGATMVTGAQILGKSALGARVRLTESGDEFEIRCKVVIAAGGIWNEEIYASFGLTPGYRIKMSKGVHLMLPKSAIDAKTGIILKTAVSVLFIIPWGDRWLVGTTDTPFTGDRSAPLADESDVQYILDQANKVLVPHIKREQVISVYAGLRPLVSPSKESSTTKISREHTVDHPVPGFVSIAGGKYTTYRVMARDAVDSAVKDLAIAGRSIPQSTTENIPLLGAAGYRELEKSITSVAQKHGVSTARIERALNRYGDCIKDLLEMIDSDPSLGEDLAENIPYIRAEALYAVTHEGARTLEDILERRMRISIESREHGVVIAKAVAELVAPVLGWNESEQQEQVSRYASKMSNEMAALEG